MKTVRVGFSRLYNAGMCELLNGEKIAFQFTFESIDVKAYIGPHHKHLVMSGTVGPPEPKDDSVPRKPTRARGYQFPRPDLHPADLYVELIASQSASVTDELAEAFYAKKPEARSAVMRIAEEQEALFESALDYAAGMIGLRLNCQFINKPIDTQCFAYRRKGEPYSFSFRFRSNTVEACKLDLSEEGKSEFRTRFPQPRHNWPWRTSADVLAWLLRAWAAEDPIQRFVSLFIPLECVIPAIPENVLIDSEWGRQRKELLTLVKEYANEQQRKSLSKMIKGTLVSPPLVERFTNWARTAALPGWESDIAAFRRFYQMRNHLVHRGKSDVELRVMLEPKDVRTLEDITERYISLALFGDADVYPSATRPKWGK